MDNFPNYIDEKPPNYEIAISQNRPPQYNQHNFPIRNIDIETSQNEMNNIIIEFVKPKNVKKFYKYLKYIFYTILILATIFATIIIPTIVIYQSIYYEEGNNNYCYFNNNNTVITKYYDETYPRVEIKSYYKDPVYGNVDVTLKYPYEPLWLACKTKKNIEDYIYDLTSHTSNFKTAVKCKIFGDIKNSNEPKYALLYSFDSSLAFSCFFVLLFAIIVICILLFHKD